MNEYVPVERTLGDLHSAAIDAVNRWRGHCVECYARLEYEVTETLPSILAIADSKASVPHNFGEKVKKLRAAIEPGGLHSKLASALDDFEEHLSRRNLLVHATGKVWTNGKSDWLWSYRFRPSGKGHKIELGYFERDEAIKIEKALASRTQSLRAQLRAIRQTLESATK